MWRGRHSMSQAQPGSGGGSAAEDAVVPESESWSQPDSDMPRMMGALCFIVDARLRDITELRKPELWDDQSVFRLSTRDRGRLI